jgi:hypothetical protein
LTGTPLAHGFGGASDLPIPGAYVIWGGGIALLVSFGVLAFAWREPRFAGDSSGRPLPQWLARFIDSPALRTGLVVVALLFAGWVTLAAMFGSTSLVNPVFGAVYVALWVGLVPTALLFGPVYRWCNPLRWIHRGLAKTAAIDRRRGLIRYPDRLGYWPAGLGLLAFVSLELVDPNVSQSLTAIRYWFAVMATITILGAVVFGDVWFARADPFEVYATQVARLSPLARRDDGVLVLRNPLENLDTTPAVPGLVGVAAVLFGSTAFDSFHEGSRWLNFSQSYTNHRDLVEFAGLFGFVLVVLVTFSLASMATAVLGHDDRRSMPRRLSHSIVPIVVGYVVAHYLTFFVSNGLQLIAQLTDPFTRGWDPVPYLDAIEQHKYDIFQHPTAIAVTKVVAVVIGHILGVIAAHDRAIRELPRRHALVGQLPVLLLMVAYTITGLWLLFSS